MKVILNILILNIIFAFSKSLIHTSSESDIRRNNSARACNNPFNGKPVTAPGDWNSIAEWSQTDVNGLMTFDSNNCVYELSIGGLAPQSYYKWKVFVDKIWFGCLGVDNTGNCKLRTNEQGFVRLMFDPEKKQLSYEIFSVSPEIWMTCENKFSSSKVNAVGDWSSPAWNQLSIDGLMEYNDKICSYTKELKGLIPNKLYKWKVVLNNSWAFNYGLNGGYNLNNNDASFNSYNGQARLIFTIKPINLIYDYNFKLPTTITSSTSTTYLTSTSTTSVTTSTNISQTNTNIQTSTTTVDFTTTTADSITTTVDLTTTTTADSITTTVDFTTTTADFTTTTANFSTTTADLTTATVDLTTTTADSITTADFSTTTTADATTTTTVDSTTTTADFTTATTSGFAHTTEAVTISSRTTRLIINETTTSFDLSTTLIITEDSCTARNKPIAQATGDWLNHFDLIDWDTNNTKGIMIYSEEECAYVLVIPSKLLYNKIYNWKVVKNYISYDCNGKSCTFTSNEAGAVRLLFRLNKPENQLDYDYDIAPCGDEDCSPGETCSHCPADCGSCDTTECGNGICEENEECPLDCLY